MRFELLFVLVMLSACTHWGASPQSPQAMSVPPVNNDHPSRALGARIRVTLETGERVVVVAPMVRGEFLTGRPECAVSGCDPVTPVNIRLASIRKVETRRLNVGSIVGAVVGVGVLGGLVALYVTVQNSGF